MGLQVDFSRLDAQDVLDIAIQVEQEAEDNYEQLATWLAADGNDETARFFKKMAGFEAKHREQLAALGELHTPSVADLFVATMKGGES